MGPIKDLEGRAKVFLGMSINLKHPSVYFRTKIIHPGNAESEKDLWESEGGGVRVGVCGRE